MGRPKKRRKCLVNVELEAYDTSYSITNTNLDDDPNVNRDRYLNGDDGDSKNCYVKSPKQWPSLSGRSNSNYSSNNDSRDLVGNYGGSLSSRSSSENEDSKQEKMKKMDKKKKDKTKKNDEQKNDETEKKSCKKKKKKKRIEEEKEKEPLKNKKAREVVADEEDVVEEKEVEEVDNVGEADDDDENNGDGEEEEEEEEEELMNSVLASNEIGLEKLEIDEFERNGFVLLKHAFCPKAANKAREVISRILEERFGVNVLDPQSWVERQGIPECFGFESGYPFDEILSSKRLCRALDQLCGYKRWKQFGLGWWIISFPGFHSPPWGVAGHWHIDGAHYVHHVNSVESGLVPLFLFNDIQSPTAGGTALVKGSHLQVAKVLMDSEPFGMKSKQLNKMAISTVFGNNMSYKDSELEICQVVGNAGDVMLTHPFLLHARSKNLGEVGPSSVRFMCNPNIALTTRMQIPRRKQALEEQISSGKFRYTPVERAAISGIVDKAL